MFPVKKSNLSFRPVCWQIRLLLATSKLLLLRLTHVQSVHPASLLNSDKILPLGGEFQPFANQRELFVGTISFLVNAFPSTISSAPPKVGSQTHSERKNHATNTRAGLSLLTTLVATSRSNLKCIWIPIQRLPPKNLLRPKAATMAL